METSSKNDYELLRVPKIPLALHILGVISAIYSIYHTVIKDRSLPNSIFYALFTYGLAIIAFGLISFANENRRSSSFTILPYLFFIEPWGVWIISENDSTLRDNRYFLPENLYFIVTCIQPILVGLILFRYLSFRKNTALYIRRSEEVVLTELSPIKQHLPDPEKILGKGSTQLDKVITSMISRAIESEKMTNLSLIIMVTLVLIGGGASIGTIALGQLSNIRDLEKEKKLFVGLNKQLEFWKINNLDSSKTAAFKQEIRNIISEHTIDAKSSYDEILKRIESQAVLNWPDITMRIAIAALTLFLVQVFFHIYKFNQQQVFHLFTKAEIMELYKESDMDKKELMVSLLAKMDGGPAFGKSPATPTEQLINLLDKVKPSK